MRTGSGVIFYMRQSDRRRNGMDGSLGKAAWAMFAIACVSGITLLFSKSTEATTKPDLIYATFAAEHVAAYRPAIKRFEELNHCKIQLQLVDANALQDRLQSSLQVGAAAPDMVELLFGTLGLFTNGSLQDVKLVDVTDRVEQQQLKASVVANRFARWSSRGRIFALPHDVHPVMLVYRRDLCDQLGIDVSQLKTWADFTRVGKTLKDKHLPGDQVNRHYMIDLQYDGGDALMLLLIQRGGGMFDANGNVIFDSPIAVDTVCWYIEQTQGDNPVGYGCGSGQALSRAMLDGLALFYFCPDWRTRQIQNDVPDLAGKLALMPLPAWEPGGIRTSTWGGTGLAITKQCRRVDLAWKLAMYLYYDAAQVGPRFAQTNILPPLKAAWSYPEFDAKNPFFSGIELGHAYAELAPQVPKDYSTAYITQATSKLSDAYSNAMLYYTVHGEAGLREYTAGELKRCADQVRLLIARNHFLNTPRSIPVP
ncbi:MAG: ABC transporter substrate-binding protein [Tepidisphaeraceae bacterium]